MGVRSTLLIFYLIHRAHHGTFCRVGLQIELPLDPRAVLDNAEPVLVDSHADVEVVDDVLDEALDLLEVGLADASRSVEYEDDISSVASCTALFKSCCCIYIISLLPLRPVVRHPVGTLILYSSRDARLAVAAVVGQIEPGAQGGM